ncbi:MAG: ferredoxin [Candidatus Loosdrechtia sp.]|uniref:ferredoxin n=1 Tax=Candidatus Loosdrechtia sp. TaxID=3101272 RepID=UPI003A65E026|nr:MAG: hypothetical protein QY305_00915 [Candidatus Jettenia sp. AMX2]
MRVDIVWFEGDCVKCAMCVEEAAGIFDFTRESGPQVKEDIDIASFAEGIKRAAYLCPTQCIKYNL